MLVKDVLASKRSKGNPLGVGSDDMLADAVKIMVEHDTGSCLVLDGGKLLGLVTFKEVLELLAKDAAGYAKAKVSAVMNPDPEIATPEDTIDQTRNLMTSKHIRYLPVMDRGKLIDVVSFYDIARAVAKRSDFENRMLKQYINDWPEEQA